MTIENGQIRFAPGAAFDHLALGTNEIVTLSYVVRDQAGTQSTGTIALTVAGANDRPATTGDVASVLENGSVTFFPLGNDSDIDDGARLSIANPVLGDNRGSATIAGTTSNRIVYQTGRDFDRLAPGATQQIVLRYDVIDQDGGSTPSSTTITITGINDAPRAKGDKVVRQEDTAIVLHTATLLRNDRDPDAGQTLTVTGVKNAVNGIVTLADGFVTFVPTADYAGPASFVYTVSDGAGGEAETSVAITLRPVNDAGIARDDAFAISEAAVLSGNLFADNGAGADSDVDSALRIAAIDGSARNVGQAITLASGATLVVAANGKFTYDPSDATQSDSFSYTLSGGGTATATIAVSAASAPGGDPAPDAGSTAAGLSLLRAFLTVDHDDNAGLGISEGLAIDRIGPAKLPVAGMDFLI